MVQYSVLVILVSIPIINAWNSSTEDRRDPPKYHKDLTDETDAIEYRKDTTSHRKTPVERKKETTDYLDPIERRKELDFRREPDYLKDPIERRKDFRIETKEYRKDPTEHRNKLAERSDLTGYRREPRELRRVHYHAKRHMLPDSEPKKRSTTLKPVREIRKKPSGHLAPLEDDDMENDEVVSVAIGPPPLRGKYEKSRKKTPKPITTPPTSSAVGLVKDLLSQITKEFLSRDVDENFVFGQYLGNSMKNLTSELRLSMQHEILELIVKYQKANNGEVKAETEKTPQMIQMLKDVKIEKKFTSVNDTEEPWPDFSNLAKIVG